MIIRAFDENRDVDGFLELYQVCFGKPMSRHYLEWKYLNNPFKTKINPIIVTEEENHIIGARCDVLIRMMIQGTVTYSLQECDVMVHPTFRGRGIHHKMDEFRDEIYREAQYSLSYALPE